MATRTGRKAIHVGSETGSRRRTLIDDRSGVVVDISQAGPDDEPTLYIEVYPWPTGHTATVTTLPGNHPSMVVYIRPRTEDETR